MNAESNVEFVKDLFAAFGRGDIDYFIDAHADDAVTESPVSHTSTLPWAGVRRGRRELIEHFETIVAHVRPEPFRDVVFTASGDRVVAEGSNAGTVVATRARNRHERVERPWSAHIPARRLGVEGLCRMTRRGVLLTTRRESATNSELCIARCVLDGEEGGLSTRISIPHRLH